MKQCACWAGLVALVGAALLALRTGGASAKDPTVKEIMDRLHKGANAPLVHVKKELQSAQTDWDDVQKMAREFDALGAALGKNAPPAGDKASWARLAKDYGDNAHALDDAAQKKDKRAGLSAQAKLAGSCTTCHKAHRQ
jgi:hypothetical protein